VIAQTDADDFASEMLIKYYNNEGMILVDSERRAYPLMDAFRLWSHGVTWEYPGRDSWKWDRVATTTHFHVIVWANVCLRSSRAPTWIGRELLLENRLHRVRPHIPESIHQRKCAGSLLWWSTNGGHHTVPTYVELLRTEASPQNLFVGKRYFLLAGRKPLAWSLMDGWLRWSGRLFLVRFALLLHHPH